MSRPIPPMVPLPPDDPAPPAPPPDQRRDPGVPYPVPQGGSYPPEQNRLAPTDSATEDEAAARQRDAARRQSEDLLDLITDYRRTSRHLLDQLTDSATPSERRADLAEVVVAELSRQIAVERRYLVPLIRDTGGDADAGSLLDELAALEETVRQLHGQLTSSGPDHPEAGSLGGQLAQRLDRRAGDQEEHLFPRLREACAPEQLREAAQRARAAWDSAPTRPHPHTPDRPPWSTVTDPVVGATDRVRDEMTGRPTDPRDIA